jgi:hypothetical protein
MKNSAATAVAEALADFKVRRRRPKTPLEDNEIDDKLLFEADDELSDDELSDDELSDDEIDQQQLHSKSKNELKKWKKIFSDEEKMDLMTPWWAQKKKQMADLQFDNSRRIEHKNFEIVELKENLKYFENVRGRSNIILLLSLLTTLHSLFWYRYLPDKVQICLREKDDSWWCEVGEGAEKLINEFSKGKNLDPKDAFPVSNKNFLLMKTTLTILGINTIIVGTIQLLPFILKKKSLLPPKWVLLLEQELQQKKQDEQQSLSLNVIMDTRRISLLSTFGYWLGWVGVAVNILLLSVNIKTYQAIYFTHIASQKEEVYDNVGRGVDSGELRQIYISFIIFVIIVSIVLIHRFIKIHRYHVNEDKKIQRLQVKKGK